MRLLVYLRASRVLVAVQPNLHGSLVCLSLSGWVCLPACAALCPPSTSTGQTVPRAGPCCPTTWLQVWVKQRLGI